MPFRIRQSLKKHPHSGMALEKSVFCKGLTGDSYATPRCDVACSAWSRQFPCSSPSVGIAAAPLRHSRWSLGCRQCWTAHRHILRRKVAARANTICTSVSHMCTIKDKKRNPKRLWRLKFHCKIIYWTNWGHWAPTFPRQPKNKKQKILIIGRVVQSGERTISSSPRFWRCEPFILWPLLTMKCRANYKSPSVGDCSKRRQEMKWLWGMTGACDGEGANRADNTSPSYQ